jgi:hypothetical protein
LNNKIVTDQSPPGRGRGGLRVIRKIKLLIYFGKVR